MYTYRLRYINLHWQDKETIVLDRFDITTNTAIRVRASKERKPYCGGYENSIDVYSGTVAAIKRLSTMIHKHDVITAATEKLYTSVFNLLVETYPGYPEIIRRIFIGDIVTECDILRGVQCDTTITDPRPEQKQLVDRIIDSAKPFASKR
jgi:hypothetical protein